MNENLHFSKSPLTEALIDIRVKPKDGLVATDFAYFPKGYEREYPKRRDKLFFQHELSIDVQSPSIVNGTLVGYDFISEDELQFIQAKLDGFTFNRLAPYNNWETLRNEACRWWQVYKGIAQPQSINRLAVRYINKLDLPLPIPSLNEYLLSVPEVAPGLPQDLDAYLMQLRISYKDINATLILNEATSPATAPDTVSIVLDIDLFRENDVPSDENDIWAYLDQLRTKKNEIFLACLTTKAKELIT